MRAIYLSVESDQLVTEGDQAAHQQLLTAAARRLVYEDVYCGSTVSTVEIRWRKAM